MRRSSVSASLKKRDNVAVVYLARAAEGVETVGRFVASYRSISAGCEHDLVIVQKGTYEAAQKRRLNELLSSISHRTIEIDDTGFDISAYLAAARELSHERLCFLNTFTEIVADGWLAKLDASLEERVGVVGATGSYESLYSSLELLSKAAWFAEIGRMPYDDSVARHYHWWFSMHAPSWLTGPLPQLKRVPLKLLLSRVIYKQPTLEQRWALHWPLVRDGILKLINDVPRFPNPHIRSNAFMIRRSQLLAFDWPAIVTKDDTSRFESGYNSLTARLRKQGFSALVVGRDGAYDIPKWPTSGTFRSGSQSNLLLSDNQTRLFNTYSEPEKRIHRVMTWGNISGLDVSTIPLFGLAESFNLRVPTALTSSTCAW